ncbi:F-box/kelch-repeat protein At3g23880-like [Corylus avellana]|uniref:F-box/kelch-repeat protein At3g23880-like n=1 Tax=Corylus avellana TaxID=13451 RepID=UPI001E222C11|nr:F-box/kelch-repeat protein At3g23880-like [Corylus avellana]
MKQQRNLKLMAKELPEDLVTQILQWLPVVSLLHFKCICKSWYALITHQYVIRKHLLHNKKNNNTHLLLKMFNRTTNSYVISTLSYETLQVSLTQRAPPPFLGIDKEMCVVGSCNGLVCLHNNSYYEFNVVIWNFATKETKVVPKSNLPRLSSGHCSRYEVIGFGFDAKTNEYKISNLLSLYDPNSFQSELCSLSANSWREVDSPPCVIRADFRGIDSYINGMASWEASLDDWEGVLTFHMSDEVFLKTPLPDDVIYYNWRYFFWLNESIAMAVSIYEWLLLEVGVKDSWTKLFTIGPFTRID